MFHIQHSNGRFRNVIIIKIIIYHISMFGPSSDQKTIIMLIKTFLANFIQIQLCWNITKNIKTHKMNNCICSWLVYCVQRSFNFFFKTFWNLKKSNIALEKYNLQFSLLSNLVGPSMDSHIFCIHVYYILCAKILLQFQFFFFILSMQADLSNHPNLSSDY